MKLYTGIGPNPRVVRMFLAEKGVSIPLETVDLLGGENRRGSHLERNPAGQLPSLELDDGRHLAEITAICEYLEEKYPNPPLIGATAGTLAGDVVAGCCCANAGEARASAPSTQIKVRMKSPLFAPLIHAARRDASGCASQARAFHCAFDWP